jgi:hypothetical protein
VQGLPHEAAAQEGARQVARYFLTDSRFNDQLDTRVDQKSPLEPEKTFDLVIAFHFITAPHARARPEVIDDLGVCRKDEA